MEHSPLVLHAIPERQVLALVHDLLRRHDRDLAIPRNCLSGLQAALNQLLPGGKGPCCNTPLPSLLSGEVLPRQDQLHGASLPNRPRQPLAASGTWNRAQLDLGLAKVRSFCTVQDIAHQGQLTAAAEGVPGNSGDDWLLDVRGQRGPRFDEGSGVGLAEGQGGHFFDIGASGECPLGAGEEDGSYIGGGIELCEGLVQFGDKGCAKGVESLGAIEGDWCFVSIELRGLIGGRRLLCPTPGRGCDVSMNSYDLKEDTEKPRVTAGREDCFTNLEAAGLKVLRVFIVGFGIRRLLVIAGRYRFLQQSELVYQI